ncbi:DUF6037 family protein [Metabacillus litoralis]|jgi:hypothetical protein|uniref:DUF6037 family protein n=1 Tax=Metabacillus litoralis TaxID=152268 RepID=UPI00203CA03A|nr:DUF6037 family protein [Metabacillus litoralis]MCM3654151.1 DUF6037 family protein [Metabacillus litoralis]
MILTNLKQLFKDIKKNGLTYDVFDFTKNNVSFNILFDINPKPYKLIILKKRSSLFIKLDVNYGFVINPHLSINDYKTLISMLELKFQTGSPFSTKVFFEELNRNIPSEITKKVVEKRTLSKIYNCEEEEKVYIKEIRDWSKYPHLNKSCSPENKEKTRLLYPELYEEIKDKNISVFYTQHTNESNKNWRIMLKN